MDKCQSFIYCIKQEIYNAMDSDDISEVVMVLLNHVRKYPRVPKPINTFIVHEMLENARHFHEKSEYRLTLIYFNKALSCADKNSQMQLKCYIYRNYFLFSMKQFQSCLDGIQIVKSTGRLNPTQLSAMERLEQTCTHAIQLRKSDEEKPDPRKNMTDFFNFTGVRRNERIPCALALIHAKVESGMPVIKATKPIPIGTLVAVEKAFISLVNSNQRYTTCHHCLKITFNLIPCDGCTYTMYCSNKCMQIAKTQYHEFECVIMDLLEGDFSYFDRMAVKTALKIKMACATWNEFIEASDKLGANENGLPINEIFDRRNKFSLLKCRPEKIYIQGKIYNVSIDVANLIQRLESVGFFPSSDPKKEIAIRAFARVLMHLVVFPPKAVSITSCVDNKSFLTQNIQHNTGWFSFASRLEHSCDPNLLHLGIGDTVALVAIRNIPKGSDLTISYLGHFYNWTHSREIRAARLMTLMEIVCHCQVCTGGWSTTKGKCGTLTAQERACYDVWKKAVEESKNCKESFQASCKAVSALQSANGMTEHRQFHNVFTGILWNSQNEAIKKLWKEDNKKPEPKATCTENLSF